MYSRRTEIRHLALADVHKLSMILDQTQHWKKLMRSIPKNLTTLDSNCDNTVGKYNSDHIHLIENAANKQNRLAAEILMDEWGTSGRKRPTLAHLLQLLVKAELFRAADFVAQEILIEPPPQRPEKGPAAKVDIYIPELETAEVNAIEEKLNGISYPDTANLQNNARIDSNLNNEDFYTKLGQFQNKVSIEHSDLIKFSSSNIVLQQPNSRHRNNIEPPSVSNNISSQNPENSENLPQNISLSLSGSLPQLSILNNNSNDMEQSETDVEIGDSGFRPNISLLNADSDEHELPNLSALNLDKDAIIPNLSMLNEADSPLNDSTESKNSSASNFDSSLTSVTEDTSNSFINNDNDSLANIPCISKLQNSS